MMENKRIPSSKGTIALSIHCPTRKTERLALLCPGLLDSKDYQHLVGLAHALCGRMEYTVVRMQPTGTWDSEGDIADYTTTQYLDDIQHVIEYMLTQAKFTHILIGGHSRGGKVSLLTAARDPRISAVLGIMPSSSRNKRLDARRDEWEKQGYHSSMRDVPGSGHKKTIEFRLPFSHVLDNDRHTVLDTIKNIKVPIFLFAGERDQAIPPSDVQRLYDEANEPKRFIIIPNIGHDYRHSDGEVKIVNDLIVQELTRYFGEESVRAEGEEYIIQSDDTGTI